jgi:hypothetical protein
MLKPLSTLYKTLAVAAVLGGGMNQAAAHDIYIWPSFFSVNGDKATAVPVDLAASHTPFRGDFSLSKNGLSVYGVDGKEIRDTGAYYQGERRSSFDLKVSEPGTYAVVYSRDPSFFTSYTIGKKDTIKHHRCN